MRDFSVDFTKGDDKGSAPVSLIREREWGIGDGSKKRKKQFALATGFFALFASVSSESLSHLFLTFNFRDLHSEWF
jgi:hypothetical protein